MSASDERKRALAEETEDQGHLQKSRKLSQDGQATGTTAVSGEQVHVSGSKKKKKKHKKGKGGAVTGDRSIIGEDVCSDLTFSAFHSTHI